jgi:uncharacterized membrane protein SirB2
MVSICSFVLRWILRMRESPIAFQTWVRITPHVIDTLFLASAIAMVFIAQQIPVGPGWLSAKLSGLVVYIILGMLAMLTAPVRSRSIPLFFAAVLVFAWIVSVAIFKNPLGFFA